MATIIPIPTTRVSDTLVNQRLVYQLDADEVNLTQLQTEVSTGQSMVLPSDNPTAAENGIELMQQITQNTQYQANVSANQTYLTTTDSAMTSIGNLLNTAQSTAQSAIGSTVSTAQQQAAAQQMEQIINQLVDIGNQTIQGRYLFAGSQTSVQPFTYDGGYVQYNGNESPLDSYSDLNQVFATNVNGNGVFGTLSSASKATTNLAPVVTASTQLSDLHGGQGIAKGSIAISNGSETSIIDLSGAQTVGDVVAMIEANRRPAPGQRVDKSPGWMFRWPAGRATFRSKRSVAARRLRFGHLTVRRYWPGPITGSDFNPQLTLTTPLNDTLGTRPSAESSRPPRTATWFFKARVGIGTNGAKVSFANNPAITEGNETVSYDPIAGT